MKPLYSFLRVGHIMPLIIIFFRVHCYSSSFPYIQILRFVEKVLLSSSRTNDKVPEIWCPTVTVLLVSAWRQQRCKSVRWHHENGMSQDEINNYRKTLPGVFVFHFLKTSIKRIGAYSRGFAVLRVFCYSQMSETCDTLTLRSSGPPYILIHIYWGRN
jgi:hypothetical protein